MSILLLAIFLFLFIVAIGQVVRVGIAHRGDTEYLKSIPNGSENDNLGNLPSVSPEPKSKAVSFKAAGFHHENWRF